MLRSLIACSAILLAAVTARAATNDESVDFKTCAKKAHGATYPMLHCYSEEMKAADDAMTATYDRVREDIANPTTKNYLTRSQKAWEDYRDAWCEATVSRSGSLARIRLMECRIDETKKRTQALADLAGPQ